MAGLVAGRGRGGKERIGGGRVKKDGWFAGSKDRGVLSD